MTINALLNPLRLGRITLPNRIIMAPLTRMRAGPSGVPLDIAAEYYSQRATAGLIIAEATRIGSIGQSYPGMPGIHTPEQIQGWKKVTEAVHAKGGRIVLQIVHGGRIGHSSYHADKSVPAGPSALAPSTGMAFTPEFALVEFEKPTELSLADITRIIAEFRQAAKNAIEAGFDGVEIHAANGYLIDQFLNDGSNQRQDQYGGSFENRTRFLLEVVGAISEEIGIDRVGIRLSPFSQFNDMHDSATLALFNFVITQLNRLQPAYLHLIEARAAELGLSDDMRDGLGNNITFFRKAFNGPVISAGGYTKETGESLIADGLADAVAFGRMFIANPDLVERFKTSAELNHYDRNTFYGGAEAGYLDYPLLNSNQETATA